MSRGRNNRSGGNSLKIDLIRQALVAAERFTHLANLLLAEYGEQNMPFRGESRGGDGRISDGRNGENRGDMGRNSTAGNDGGPGNNGVVRGLYVQLDSGQKIDLPHDYIVQSQVVFGDRIKVIIEPGQNPQFKFIERVRRERINALLVQKDGLLVAIADTGSYEVLPEALAAFGAKEGDKIVILLPKGDYRVPFAAVAEKISVIQSTETPKPVVEATAETPPAVKLDGVDLSAEINKAPITKRGAEAKSKVSETKIKEINPKAEPPHATIVDNNSIPVATAPLLTIPDVSAPPVLSINDSTQPIPQEVSAQPAAKSTNSTQEAGIDLVPGKSLEDDDLR